MRVIITHQDKIDFVARHKHLFTKNNVYNKNHAAIAMLAKKELGYSNKTSRVDIIASLKQWVKV
jgi:hypothetical protein